MFSGDTILRCILYRQLIARSYQRERTTPTRVYRSVKIHLTTYRLFKMVLGAKRGFCLRKSGRAAGLRERRTIKYCLRACSSRRRMGKNEVPDAVRGDEGWGRNRKSGKYRFPRSSGIVSIGCCLLLALCIDMLSFEKTLHHGITTTRERKRAPFNQTRAWRREAGVEADEKVKEAGEGNASAPLQKRSSEATYSGTDWLL